MLQALKQTDQSHIIPYLPTESRTIDPRTRMQYFERTNELEDEIDSLNLSEGNGLPKLVLLYS